MKRNKSKVDDEAEEVNLIKKRVAKERVKSEAINYLRMKCPFTISNIRSKIDSDLWWNLSNSLWSRILKEISDSVINKFSWRPSNVSFDMFEIKRALFRINLLKQIGNTDLLINIDECTINRIHAQCTHGDRKISWLNLKEIFLINSYS